MWKNGEKEKAKEQGIQHLVYPRFTRTVSPRGVITGKMHPNEAYEMIHNNDLMKIVEAWGTGIPRIISRCKEYGLKEPLFEELGDGFLVTMFRKPTNQTNQSINQTKPTNWVNQTKSMWSKGRILTLVIWKIR